MQGLSGMKTGSLGPKRQVYDKSYYMLELRKRCTDLQEEVARMNREVEEVREDNQLYQTLEKRYDSLVKTVRSLEGDLADYNLATDKQRTDTQPEEVHHMFMIMKQQNDLQRNEVDQVFLEKRSHEEELQRIHEELVAITRASEERLNELHPDSRREYELLREENMHIQQELADSRDDLDQVNARLNILEGQLQSDVLRMHAQSLLHDRREAFERLEILEVEAKQCDLSIPEQREILLARVKNDNGEIVAAEKQISELKMEKERLRTQISDIAADAQEKKEDSEQQKYEILFTKDREMTEFINSSDGLKQEQEGKLKEKQDNIVQLLENISKTLAIKDVSPEGHLRDMEDELDFKGKQLTNAESTQQRLEAELSKRQGELDKIQSLDTKINQELQQVEQKMQQYEKEIAVKFDRIEDMKT
eukprot:CAMPEP_0197917290 /NCGR_PEP_ID=MMETSP1439-20131203/83582_1 /TAXON_ID=66791 /ORGANISM="Gonyaulax spinifera, Strain CCMP409" /LENGTH=419 /DNA_ID=CAMNT_0043539367 /DNA_START=9 /DNA_END=1265 /DNA_ORIENTATION=+